MNPTRDEYKVAWARILASVQPRTIGERDVGTVVGYVAAIESENAKLTAQVRALLAHRGGK